MSNEALRLAEPPNIDNLKKIAASDSTTAIRNALLAAIKWVQHLEQSLKFEQAASFRDQVAELEAERDQLKTDLHIATDDAAQMLASTQSLRAERDQLRAEVERYRHLRSGQSWPAVFASHDAPEPLRGDELDTAIDHARTTHKDEG